MIIAFDGSRAFSKDRTGTENYSYQLLKHLAKIDHKNIYKVFLRPGAIIPPFDHPNSSLRGSTKSTRSNPDSNKDSDVTTFLGMTIYGWPENFKFVILDFQYLWTQIGLAVQTFVEPMDVLFVPAHTLPIIRAPWVKTVVTVHDLGSEYLPQTHQIKQRLYLSLMQNYQLKTATKLVAVSNATKQDLIKKIGLPAEKIEVVYEGFNKDLFKVIPEKEVKTVLKKYDLEMQGYYLFVSTVQPRKNLERIIRAYAHTTSLRGTFSSHERYRGELALNEVKGGNLDSNIDSHGTSSLGMTGDKKLIIVGKKGWKSDGIYTLTKKLGIEDRVRFLDYVKDEDLLALYNGAIALVYPSLFEGFGLPILEAQACGTPVITSNISSMPEVAGYVRVNRNVAGDGAVLVDPYSVEQITDGMIRIMNHELRIKVIKAGLENVKKFSWEKCAKETLKLIESL